MHWAGGGNCSKRLKQNNIDLYISIAALSLTLSDINIISPSAYTGDHVAPLLAVSGEARLRRYSGYMPPVQ